MTTATPSLTLVITVPSLSCRSSKASCSPFESFEYFDGLICAVLIFFFFNVLIVWCFFCLFFFGGGEGYLCFISHFSKYIFFSFWFICLVSKMCFKFNSFVFFILFRVAYFRKNLRQALPLFSVFVSWAH